LSCLWRCGGSIVTDGVCSYVLFSSQQYAFMKGG
jgi:hypothetical protein